MEFLIPPDRLDRPVDHETDHVLGSPDAEITLVEYDSYACPHCRAANERIAQARDQLGDCVCYAIATDRPWTTVLRLGPNKRAFDDSTRRYDSSSR